MEDARNRVIREKSLKASKTKIEKIGIKTWLEKEKKVDKLKNTQRKLALELEKEEVRNQRLLMKLNLDEDEDQALKTQIKTANNQAKPSSRFDRRNSKEKNSEVLISRKSQEKVIQPRAVESQATNSSKITARQRMTQLKNIGPKVQTFRDTQRQDRTLSKSKIKIEDLEVLDILGAERMLEKEVQVLIGSAKKTPISTKKREQKI